MRPISVRSRREFVQQVAVVTAALIVPFRDAQAAPGISDMRSRSHPVPRAGVSGAKVLTKEQLASSTHLVQLFDGIRAIPGVADGIRCNCGCAEQSGIYSLLSCYEGDGMARTCPICQGEGRVTVRLHKEGKTLEQIRAAIDAQFG